MSLLQVALNLLNAAGSLINPATAEGQQRHETRAAAQYVVPVPSSTAATLSSLLAALTPAATVPSWATSCRIFVPSVARIAYSTDGASPSFASGDIVHGTPLAADTQGFPVFGPANLAAMKLVAESGTLKVAIEFLG